MMGRGLDVAMPVILLGAIGGMIASGIIGLFAGAVALPSGINSFSPGWSRTHYNHEPADLNRCLGGFAGVENITTRHMAEHEAESFRIADLWQRTDKLSAELTWQQHNHKRLNPLAVSGIDSPGEFNFVYCRA